MSVVYVRVLLEIVVVLFRISDNTAKAARHLSVLGAELAREGTVGSTDRPAEGR